METDSRTWDLELKLKFNFFTIDVVICILENRVG